MISWRRTVWVLGSLLLASTGYSHAEIPNNCFRHHLREAIELNEARRPLYSRASYGESEAVTETLIGHERVGILIGYYFDWRAQPWRDAGIPLLCDEFVPMAGTPEFSIQSPVDDAEKFEPLDGCDVRKELKEVYKAAGFEGVYHATRAKIASLESQPHYSCMTRHVLESVARAALLAPRHAEAARAQGLESPEKVSWLFIRLQLFSLADAVRLDEQAYPIQKQGIPILCGDVPPIPFE